MAPRGCAVASSADHSPCCVGPNGNSCGVDSADPHPFIPGLTSALGNLPKRWVDKTLILASAVFLWTGLVPAGEKQFEPKPVALTEEGRSWVEKTLKSLSLEEKRVATVRVFLTVGRHAQTVVFYSLRSREATLG